MTTRNRNFQRTPRRRKFFAQYNRTFVMNLVVPKIDDMLNDALNELGVSNLGGLTVMDVTGTLRLVNGSVGAASDVFDDVGVGYNWFDPNVAQASDGDAQIPEPVAVGLRESKWIQQWRLRGGEQSSASVQAGAPVNGHEDETFINNIHVRNMRKQPAADSRLCMVVAGGELWEASTVELRVNLLIMVALP